MEEEESLLNFGGLFAPFAPPGTFGPGGDGPNDAGAAGSTDEAGGGGGRGGAAAGARHGRGGGAGGRGGAAAGSNRGRNRPDPLAGQCPVCRAKIKGAFNGREKNGILGLRLTVGKPVDDPREENGKMKADSIQKDAGSVDSSDTEEEEEAVLPVSQTSESLRMEEKDPVEKLSPRGERRRRRSSSNDSTASERLFLGADADSPASKRQRRASDSSLTQSE